MDQDRWEQCEHWHTDYAQDQLSDIVYLEISIDVDAEIKQADLLGSVESVKAAADIYLPVSGKVVGKNEKLSESPELINSDPYGEGWLIKIALSDESEIDVLLTPKSIKNILKREMPSVYSTYR